MKAPKIKGGNKQQTKVEKLIKVKRAAGLGKFTTFGGFKDNRIL